MTPFRRGGGGGTENGTSQKYSPRDNEFVLCMIFLTSPNITVFNCTMITLRPVGFCMCLREGVYVKNLNRSSWSLIFLFISLFWKCVPPCLSWLLLIAVVFFLLFCQCMSLLSNNFIVLVTVFVHFEPTNLGERLIFGKSLICMPQNWSRVSLYCTEFSSHSLSVVL